MNSDKFGVMLTKSDSKGIIFCFVCSPLTRIPNSNAAGIPNGKIALSSIHHGQRHTTNYAAALSGSSNNDAGDFNTGLFQYLLFAGINAGTENIWSKAGEELKAWTRKVNRKFQLITQISGKIMVLNHVNHPWIMPQEVKWNMHHGELVEFHAANSHCNVHQTCRLDKWVKNQRRSKKNDKLSINRF